MRGRMNPREGRKIRRRRTLAMRSLKVMRMKRGWRGQKTVSWVRIQRAKRAFERVEMILPRRLELEPLARPLVALSGHRHSGPAGVMSGEA